MLSQQASDHLKYNLILAIRTLTKFFKYNKREDREMKEFQISKSDFTKVRIVPTPPADTHSMRKNEILLAVEKFAYTTNNISYAIAGDRLGYWEFFPPQGEDTDWIVTPVWGFAKVIASNHTKIGIGERLYGYFPPAHYLTLKPTQVTKTGFVDGSDHRKNLAVFYNQYEMCSALHYYTKEDDNARMLFGPLHLTAFMMLHFLKENDWKGAEQIVILSASSKTSLGMAFAFNQTENSPQVIGFTSSRNLENISELELYDELYTYENVSQIDGSKPTVIIDMSGLTELVNSLFVQLGDQLITYIQIGRTHWTTPRTKSIVPKDKLFFFFAPGIMKKKQDEWGKAEYDKITAEFIKSSAKKISTWMSYETHDELNDLVDIHQQLSEGSVPPDKGIIIKLI